MWCVVIWVFVFPGPPLSALPAAQALDPNLNLPALAPNLYLTSLSPNLYLLTLAPNLYLLALVSPEPGLHIPKLPPEYVFTGPGVRFLLQYSEFAFTFLFLVVAVTVIILAIVAIS